MVVCFFHIINYEDNPPPLPLAYTYLALPADQGGHGRGLDGLPTGSTLAPYPAFQHCAPLDTSAAGKAGER